MHQEKAQIARCIISDLVTVTERRATDRSCALRGNAACDALRQGLQGGRGASKAAFPRGAQERSLEAFGVVASGLATVSPLVTTAPRATTNCTCQRKPLSQGLRRWCADPLARFCPVPGRCRAGSSWHSARSGWSGFRR
ncbi:hypothetical protein B7453_25125 [Pseudomonas sp. IB20]|nr:hypothetical protein B7453_25125 [Pseudomonas sp. IB20]